MINEQMVMDRFFKVRDILSFDQLREIEDAIDFYNESVQELSPNVIAELLYEIDDLMDSFL
jgi:hypothetical protein